MSILKHDQNFSSQTDDNVLSLISSARYALQNDDFETAEQDLHLGLAISNNLGNFTQVPYIYDILSAMAFSTGKLEKAANILEEAVRELVTLGHPEHGHHVTDFRFRLARIFGSLGKSEIAEKGFQNSLEVLRKEVEKGNSHHSKLHYANFLFRYGLYKVRHTEYLEAKEMLDKALEYLQFNEIKQMHLLKSLSCTLSDLCGIIANDQKALANFADILPFLKLPEISDDSNDSMKQIDGLKEIALRKSEM
ncbi:tetratricopeptide repeat protein 19 homolog, mitochondrial-like [Coccinella septempunctata]|uniref:tetratricopeptide repeat protein 19 homolog, mitochondrial-like n=1 Tax=Coccinella septempunctata TaxID=41139 RepID=UPI001D05C3FD|nr:tetratricopeptide repeat protein 19 homolog, mitochondrial-like [Coccinella septempunctata]